MAASPVPRTLRVFLCHASADKSAVRDLHTFLNGHGFDPWLDELNLIPGQEWRQEIPRAVRAADAVLVCLSRQSITKEGYVQKEIKIALDVADEKPEGTIFIIPLRLEQCDVPERLREWQWVDLFQELGRERLLKALRTRAASLHLIEELAPGTIMVNPKDGQKCAWIPPGDFLMGATPGDGEAGFMSIEKPRHRVRISRGFWLGCYPVTVGAYKVFARETGRTMPLFHYQFNPQWSKDDHPMVQVNWEEARAYCEWAGGRLPTEAEWEYAARAGQEGLRYIWGNTISPENANYNKDPRWNGTSPVGSYPANSWGLFDMAGNVCEWISDYFSREYYNEFKSGKLAIDPRGPSGRWHAFKGSYPIIARVVRGGSWVELPKNLRASARDLRNLQSDEIGFRLTCDVLPSRT